MLALQGAFASLRPYEATQAKGRRFSGMGRKARPMLPASALERRCQLYFFGFQFLAVGGKNPFLRHHLVDALIEQL